MGKVYSNVKKIFDIVYVHGKFFFILQVFHIYAIEYCLNRTFQKPGMR